MAWWTIKYLATNAVYSSDMIPFKLLPEIEEVNMEYGHKFKTKELICEVYDIVKLDLNTGAIWIHNKIEAAVNSPERLILHKRNYRGNSEVKTYVYAGLIDKKGSGYLVKIYDNNKITLEKYVISLDFNEQLVQ